MTIRTTSGYGLGLVDETATRASQLLFLTAVIDVVLVTVVLFTSLPSSVLGSLLLIPVLTAPVAVWGDTRILAEEENWSWNRFQTAFVMFLLHGVFALLGFLAIILYFIRRWQTFNYDTVAPSPTEEVEGPSPVTAVQKRLTNDDDSIAPESWTANERDDDKKRPWE